LFPAALFSLVNKARKKALDLIEKARGIALDLVDKAREKALELMKRSKEAAPERASKDAEIALERAKKRWYSNAYHLAGFFAIPRNHTKEELTDILYKHLDLTWGEIESILKSDEAEDMEYYEQDKAHMMMFSDMLVDGLVKQFPEKFKE
jgi:enolase